MTKKTIEFKLPVRTAEPDLSTRGQDDAGQWVTANLAPTPLTEAIGLRKAQAPAHAANDPFVGAESTAPDRPDTAAALFDGAHPSRDGARLFSRSVGSVAECGIVLTLGFQAVSREWLSMPLDAAQRSLDGLQILHCRSLSDLIVLQTGLMRSNYDDALARGGRIARITMQAMGEAADTLIARAGADAGA